MIDDDNSESSVCGCVWELNHAIDAIGWLVFDRHVWWRSRTDWAAFYLARYQMRFKVSRLQPCSVHRMCLLKTLSRARRAIVGPVGGAYHHLRDARGIRYSLSGDSPGTPSTQGTRAKAKRDHALGELACSATYSCLR